ncbi:MAG TPA: dihydrolipoamide acetyltransferase family protein [Ktedonobacterales bacterium]|nr:dihydrolipoamide acetyltransferase family protein [Ktedonobacterales bacterium]
MNTVVMPKMGDTMEEGKILRWIKHEGDTIQKGDALAEIETEKVNIEAEAFVAGVLRKIVAQEGETVAVGAPIALIGKADEALPGEAAPAAQPTAKSAAKAGQQASGANSAAPAASSAATAVAEPPTTPSVGVNGTSGAAQNGGRVFISPLARHIAAEHNLDVAQIAGSGPGGRILRDDVQAYLANPQAAAPAIQTPQAQPAQPMPATPATQMVAEQPTVAVAAAATMAPGEEVRAQPLTVMRKTIARRLQQSMQTAPHFYVTVSIETNKLGEVRNSINEYAAGLPNPVKVSYNDLIVKAVALALASMPEVNVSFDGEQLLFKSRINVGVAVALDTGLIVPVVRDADKRGVLDIARESRRLVEAARAGKLKPDEFSGGTFTVSNLGMFDVESFTAVINPPESAILAVGAIVPTPVVRDGQVVVRDLMKVTLSVDHRALDGAIAARFLQEFKRLLENPMGILV